MRIDQHLKVLMGHQSHDVTGLLQALSQSQVGFNIPATSWSNNGNAQKYLLPLMSIPQDAETAHPSAPHVWPGGVRRACSCLVILGGLEVMPWPCLLYTSPSPRD